jgi:hypothetical protein
MAWFDREPQAAPERAKSLLQRREVQLEGRRQLARLAIVRTTSTGWVGWAVDETALRRLALVPRSV